MEIIEPKVELWKQQNRVSHVAKCARVCYRKTSGNDALRYNNLEKDKHLSMFRHETYYAAIPIKYHDGIIYRVICDYVNSPYIKYFSFRDNVYVITNGDYLRNIKHNNPVLYSLILKHQIDVLEAENIEYIWLHFMRYTFCIVTQISTSRELNRVSPNNISEQSTRYVYENGTICRPYWLDEDDIEKYNNKEYDNISPAAKIYLKSCDDSFNSYRTLISDYGMYRQDTRGVLPLDTATKCVYTYSIDEWRHIIDLRYYGVTGKPHPNAKIIAGMIKEQLIGLGYNI